LAACDWRRWNDDAEDVAEVVDIHGACPSHARSASQIGIQSI
jgi:hypothetical protein